MAIGKVQKKGGKKGGKKKTVDPFTKKEWYDIRAPRVFKVTNQGTTPITKSSGNRIASEVIKGRQFEVNLCDLTEEMSASKGTHAERKVKLIVDEVNGNELLTNFHGIELTREGVCDMIRKGHSLIEAHCEGRTTDGYTLRIFVIGRSPNKDELFMKEEGDWRKKSSSSARYPEYKTDKKKHALLKIGYVQMAKIRAIRKKMVETVSDMITKNNFKEVVKKLITQDFIGKVIRNQCRSITPLEHVAIKKVKVISRPKDNVDKVRELHDDSKVDTGKSVKRADKEKTVFGGGGKFN